MQSQLDRSSNRSRRHDFDSLPVVHEIGVRPCTTDEIPKLAAIARDMVPGVTLSAEQLGFYCRFNPETAFSFIRNGKLLGGISFLYLNVFGLDALILDEIDLRQPETRYLAKRDEQPAAIYWWALAATGRGVTGLGTIAEHFARDKFRSVDFYTQPSSEDGRRIITALGFVPTPSWQRDLWVYSRRPMVRSLDHQTPLTNAA